jgi:acyl-coenzyme A thioesterase PaaI-like protein
VCLVLSGTGDSRRHSSNRAVVRRFVRESHSGYPHLSTVHAHFTLALLDAISLPARASQITGRTAAAKSAPLEVD